MSKNVYSFSPISKNLSTNYNNKSKNYLSNSLYSKPKNTTNPDDFSHYHDYKNNLNYILKKVLQMNQQKYQLYNETMKKILAFKENIFIHNKNLSLYENNKNQNEKRNKIKEYNNRNSKNIRAKSSNIKFNQNIRNPFEKSKLILDEEYFDVSYIKNKKVNIYTSYLTKKNKKGNDNSLKNKHKIDLSLSKNCKKELINLKLREKNKPQIFMKRPMTEMNEKTLIYLPKTLQKDIKNKYNFFSYILADANDIYENSIDKYLNKLKNKNKNKSNKTRNISFENKKHNKNLFNNDIIKTKIDKSTNTTKHIKKKFNFSIFRKNKMYYRPVHKKFFDILKKNKTQKTKLANLNQEDIDSYQTIKSLPFKKRSLCIKKKKN